MVKIVPSNSRIGASWAKQILLSVTEHLSRLPFIFIYINSGSKCCLKSILHCCARCETIEGVRITTFMETNIVLDTILDVHKKRALIQKSAVHIRQDIWCGSCLYLYYILFMAKMMKFLWHFRFIVVNLWPTVCFLWCSQDLKTWEILD